MNLQNKNIKILLTDSRSLSNPSETLFFALVTAHNDGHKYIKDLYDKGVRDFVIQHDFPEMDTLPGANLYRTENTLTALQEIAAEHRQQFSIPIVGVTGSNGKTIVKEWLYQLLHDELNIVRSPRSYNSQTGVPLSVWQLNEQTQLGVFEAGISLPGEMEKLEKIILPTVGIFTTIGEAHQENFYSQEEKCLEKLTLFESANVIIYNEDQNLVKYCIEKKGFSDKTFSWSTRNTKAPLYISEIRKEIDHTIISYIHFEQSENRKIGEAKSSTKSQTTTSEGISRFALNEVVIPFTDDASIEDAIHCLATILYLYPETENIEKRFAKLDPVAMRLDVSKGIQNNTLINDAYNSDINSLTIALDFMARRSGSGQLKRVLILSDILQSGMVPASFYRKVAELVTEKKVEHIIGIGPHLMSHSNLFGMEKEFYPTTKSYLDSGRWRNLKNSIILIKGSRSSRFERISEQLEEKAHQTVLAVDLDAVIHNFKYFKLKLKSDTKVICMVKAFGYGVGSYELAKTLQERGADYVAVALADEGAELRREGITMPIMVMNPEEHAFNTLFEYQLEPEIYNLSMLDSIIRETERRGIMQYPIHIKLDTGMNRLGFDAEDIPLIIEKLETQQGVFVRSVFSHLAGSDSPALDFYTEQQAELFSRLAQELEQALTYPIWKHLLNSGGIERFSKYQFDMVRLGIGLYGISFTDENALKPVASLKTRILQIRDVKKGESVGYNRNQILERDSRIACLPIGYADGLDRRLGNGHFSVLVNGHLCPTVGNICMDICMIDVTNVPAEETNEVEIFGKEQSVSLVAETLGTIPYEILTSISPRVKRIYYKE